MVDVMVLGVDCGGLMGCMIVSMQQCSAAFCPCVQSPHLYPHQHPHRDIVTETDTQTETQAQAPTPTQT